LTAYHKSKPSQEGPPSSSINKYEVLGNLKETVNLENLEKEIEEKQEGPGQTGNNPDPSPKDPMANAQEEEKQVETGEEDEEDAEESQAKEEEAEESERESGHEKDYETEPEVHVHS